MATPVVNHLHLRICMEEAVEMREHHLSSPILALPRIAGYVHSGYGSLAEHRLGNAWLVAVTEKRSADEVELFVKEASRSI